MYKSLLCQKLKLHEHKARVISTIPVNDFYFASTIAILNWTRQRSSILSIVTYNNQGLPEVEVKRGKPRFFTPDVKTPAYLAEVEVKNIGRGNYLVGVEVENNSEVIYLAEVEVKKCFRGFYLAWVEV